MKRRIGICLIGVGVLFLLGSAALVCYNYSQEQHASSMTQQYLPKVMETIMSAIEEDTAIEEEDTPDPSLPSTKPTAPSDQSTEDAAASEDMTEVTIDGHSFVGYLSLPTLQIELPVLSQTNEENLRIAPCHYTGTVKTADLVIGAHNYQSHFGRLSELSVGDEIWFVDMNGVRTGYRVTELEILDPYAKQDLTAGAYPLTLFTCTYGGASRVTVRCDAMSS